ncbi:hypothetical protein BU14_0022s0067 [Porphyra umbilicalis]|uniref:Uncharacterized protein n=1 Tax=Porphyra umbilicalis TaxID=2786 RepID=A0A1X6PKF8_PORUM|nr:hypothetical protein BU14_0022s0067 [Porphyra umbilicalis]|eukprot:OSX81347.1 hypothetical protein BU14_0022s0067 [Porphyra umbilicalis]
MSMADGEAVVVAMGNAHSLDLLLEQRGHQLHPREWWLRLPVAGSPLGPAAQSTALPLVGRIVVTPLLNGRPLTPRHSACIHRHLPLLAAFMHSISARLVGAVPRTGSDATASLLTALWLVNRLARPVSNPSGPSSSLFIGACPVTATRLRD